LPADEEAPEDNKEHTPFTWASLTKEALDDIVASCVLQLTCTNLSMLDLKPPLTLIILMMIWFLPTMDHIRWFQPHKIMTIYAPYSPGRCSKHVGMLPKHPF
jgi:hypothetical protein